MGARKYNGGAAATTLASGIASGDTSISVTDASTWPATGAFSIVLARGLSGEEKILIASRSGNTLTATTRGYDGTSAAAHLAGVAAECCGTATDFQEANDHVNASAAVHGLTGTVVGTTDTQTLTNKTLTTPTIASLANATHNHSNAAGGGSTLTSPTITGATLDAASTLGGVSGTSLAADRTAWTTFVPTLVGMSLGNGTLSAAYKLVGKILHIRYLLTNGSTTSYTAPVTWSLPVGITAVAGDSQDIFGKVYNGTYNIPAFGFVGAAGTTVLPAITVSNTDGRMIQVSNTQPIAAAGALLSLNGTLEVQ